MENKTARKRDEKRDCTEGQVKTVKVKLNAVRHSRRDEEQRRREGLVCESVEVEESKEKVLMKAFGSELCLRRAVPVFCCGRL